MMRGVSPDAVVVGLRERVGVLLRLAVNVRVDVSVLVAVSVDTPGIAVSVIVGVSVFVVTGVMVGVADGFPRFHSEGMDNWPASLLPQPTTAPFARKASVWFVPAASATMRKVSVIARACDRLGGTEDCPY
jgi:hypothetical protein